MSSREAVLEVRDVVKRFGGLVALRGVSLRLYERELLGLIGPNGSGKTTLFNIITGFLRPDSGRVFYRGVDITGRPPHEIARIGVVRTFQIVRPFLGMTVLENVLTALYMRHGILSRAPERDLVREAREILASVGLEARESLRAESLTHGEKKKLEIARALALRPRVLLLDEPTGGLSSRETEEILDLVRSVNRGGVSVILIEHNMRAVMSVSERVVVLSNGVVIAEGSPREVVSNQEVVRAYLGERYVARGRQDKSNV